MGDDEADGCCTIKRGSGIFILVLSILSFVGTVICALIASWTYMPLARLRLDPNPLLLIYLISTASAYVCCRACGSKVTGGLVVGYCVLAFVTFIVLATWPAVRHQAQLCEGTVECPPSQIFFRTRVRAKTSSFSCHAPETDGAPPSRVRLHVDIR